MEEKKQNNLHELFDTGSLDDILNVIKYDIEQEEEKNNEFFLQCYTKFRELVKKKQD